MNVSWRLYPLFHCFCLLINKPGEANNSILSLSLSIISSGCFVQNICQISRWNCFQFWRLRPVSQHQHHQGQWQWQGWCFIKQSNWSVLYSQIRSGLQCNTRWTIKCNPIIIIESHSYVQLLLQANWPLLAILLLIGRCKFHCSTR